MIGVPVATLDRRNPRDVIGTIAMVRFFARVGAMI